MRKLFILIPDRPKQRGFAALPINQEGTLFVSVTLTARLIVILALSCFPPGLDSVINVSSGVIFQKRADLSML